MSRFYPRRPPQGQTIVGRAIERLPRRSMVVRVPFMGQTYICLHREGFTNEQYQTLVKDWIAVQALMRKGGVQ